MMRKNADVLVIAPPDDGDGERYGGYRPGLGATVQHSLFRKMVGYLLDVGVDIAFDDQEQFPTEVPGDTSAYKAIMVAAYDLPRLKPKLTGYEGLAEWQFTRPDRSTTFRHTSGGPWLLAFGFSNEFFYYANLPIETFMIAAGLTRSSARLRERLLARDDRALQAAMVERVMRTDRCDFTDVCSYLAKSLLGAFDVTHDRAILEHVHWIYRRALENVEFADGRPRRKQACAGTPIDFGFYLSVPTLVKLHRLDPKAEYEAALKHSFDGALDRLEVTRNWAPWPKGLHGAVGILAYHNRLAEFEDRILRYARAGYDALHDPKTHLWKYFYYADCNPPTTAFFPTHGPALALAHLVEVLEHYPRELPGYRLFLDMFVELASAVRDRQDSATGAWHCLLDAPTACSRVDYTAMFAFSFLKGVREGWLDQSFRASALNAWPFVKTHVFQGGSFGNFGGIGHSFNFDYYLMRPAIYDYLQAPPAHVLMPLSEVLRLEQGTHD